MSHFNFIVLILALYAIYYLGNIVYDLIQQKKTQSNAVSQSNVLDVSTLLDEDYSPIDAASLVQQKPKEEESREDDKMKLTPHSDIAQRKNENSFEKEADNSTEEHDISLPEESSIAEEISNVTNHGGYSIPQLKQLFNDVSAGGHNPLLGITSKMM